MIRLATELGYIGEQPGKEIEDVVGDTLRALHGLLRVGAVRKL
jgi:hypothetical protein